MELLFPLFFFGFIAYFVFTVFTKKGKGRLFGGRIVKTIDKEIKQKKGISNSTIRVHVIEKKNRKIMLSVLSSTSMRILLGV